ncbi:MAG: AtpZ/AtpI family protein [Eudoraea sp.]|jgi:membrane protein DedA with SNARE-associated domain|uniref:AtpZ/AtpI family protein n=1 Tax=Eudoraea sp. TaxID=1979955 RepID=UPI00262B8950|nr:AtpZ/AtpI family protein [uncultured Eudoraea sp.]
MAKGNKEIKYWLSLTGIAVQMGVIIYLGARLGQWLDLEYQNEKNTYTIILTLFAVAISMYLVIQQTKKLNS